MRSALMTLAAMALLVGCSTMPREGTEVQPTSDAFDPSRTYAPCGTIRLDADGDGRITNSEYTAYRTGAFSAWDTNRDGRISRAEYANCWYGDDLFADSKRPFEPSWSAFDRDNDGYLNSDEYWSAARWGELDQNGDGVVDRSEWPW